MSDCTIPEASARKRRPPNSRRPIVRRRRRLPRVTPSLAEQALHGLVSYGEFLEADGRKLLVSFVGDDLMEAIAAALGATEDHEEDDPGGGNVEDQGEDDRCDDEDNGDTEPSLGLDDRELDESDREPDNDTGGDVYALTEQDARYFAEADRRLRQRPFEDDGRYGLTRRSRQR